MPGKKTNKQSNVMSIRLDKETYDKLKRIALETGIKKSKILKTSFNKWTNLKESPMFLNSMNVGIYFMKNLFDLISENELQDLGNSLGEHWINIIKIRLIDEHLKKDMNSLLLIFTEGIGPNQASWFDKISYRILDNENVIIYGIHSLNKNFSVFFKILLEYLMKKQFNFILIEESSNISDKTVELEFKSSDKT